MIDPSMIPDEVVEAAATVMSDAVYPPTKYYPWSEQPDWHKDLWRTRASAAIAAALNAWEGGDVILNSKYNPRISLPIKENVNDRI